MEQFAKMKKKAESLLKRLIDYTKNENKGNLVGAAPENEPDQRDEGQPEPIRALKFRGKGMGSTISETVQELSQRTQEALGSKDSVQADLKVKFSEFQSRRMARETTKIANDAAAANGAAIEAEDRELDLQVNKAIATGKKVRIKTLQATDDQGQNPGGRGPEVAMG